MLGRSRFCGSSPHFHCRPFVHETYFVIETSIDGPSHAVLDLSRRQLHSLPPWRALRGEVKGEVLRLPPLTSENEEKCSGGETRTHNLAGLFRDNLDLRFLEIMILTWTFSDNG